MHERNLGRERQRSMRPQSQVLLPTEPVEHEVGTMAEPDLEKLEDTKKPEDKKPEVRKVGKFAEPDRVGLHVAPDLKGEEHPPAERKPQPPDTQPK